MVSLLNIEYSIPVFDNLTIGMSISGGDVMDIIRLGRSIVTGKNLLWWVILP